MWSQAATAATWGDGWDDPMAWLGMWDAGDTKPYLMSLVSMPSCYSCPFTRENDENVSSLANATKKWPTCLPGLSEFGGRSGSGQLLPSAEPQVKWWTNLMNVRSPWVHTSYVAWVAAHQPWSYTAQGMSYQLFVYLECQRLQPESRCGRAQSFLFEYVSLQNEWFNDKMWLDNMKRTYFVIVNLWIQYYTIYTWHQINVWVGKGAFANAGATWRCEAWRAAPTAAATPTSGSWRWGLAILLWLEAGTSVGRYTTRPGADVFFGCWRGLM